MENLLFAFAVTAYLVAGFAWPTLRLWRRYGIWPIVFSREAAPGQRLLGALSEVLFASMVVLGCLHAAVGPDALGVWHLPGIARIAGWLCLASGAGLTLVAQRQMGASWRVGIDNRPTALVTTGLFRHIRNPIFTGLLLFVAGVVILSPAWWSVAVWMLTALGLRLQIAFEERHLIGSHGEAYGTYAARAGRFVPVVGRLRATPSMRADRASAATRG